MLSPSVFITFCLLCCIPGKEVKIAFALLVCWVVLQMALQADTTLLVEKRGEGDLILSCDQQKGHDLG